MDIQFNSRRTFLRNLTLGIAGTPLAVSQIALGKPSKTDIRVSDKIRLGVASYSLRNFDRSEAIKMIRELGVEYVNIKSFHLALDSTPEELVRGRQEFEEAGLTIVGGGTISMRENDDEAIRSYFEYADITGMPLMVIAPVPETLPQIEKFVREYNIKVAIHNHGPEDPHFPAPHDAMELIKDMDPRVGICNDLGHTARTGADIIESLDISGDRLFDIHLKDLKDMEDNDSQCVIGEGQMPVADIFHRLVQMNYPGYVNLEYEIEPDNPLMGMKQSFSYMQGVIDGLGKSVAI